MATVIKQKREATSQDLEPEKTAGHWQRLARQFAGSGLDGIRRFFWRPSVVLSYEQRLLLNQQLLESFSRRAVYWMIALSVTSLLIYHYGAWAQPAGHTQWNRTAWMLGIWLVFLPVSVFLFTRTIREIGRGQRNRLKATQWIWFALITAASFWWAAANFALNQPPLSHSPAGFYLGQITFLWLTLIGQVITLLLLCHSIRTMLGVLIIGVGLPFWIHAGKMLFAQRITIFEWYNLQLAGYCAIAWFLFLDHARAYAREILLSESRSRAESAVEAKNQFIASISHDLRQPLTTLALQLNGLERKARSQEHLVDSIGAAQRQVLAMETMINGALDVARLESGTWKVEVREVAISPLLDSIMRDMEPGAAEKAIRLSWHSSPYLIKTDWHAIDRIIRNLVANAIRYTPSPGVDGLQGHILVGCQKRGNQLRISVWDNGIGIPANKCTEIFKQYVQLGNPERDREKGFGLGLSIVNGLTNLLSHPLEVQSTLGRGSRFSVRVPIVGRIPPELLGAGRAAVSSGDPDLTGMTVVVIDDDRDLRHEISRRFIECGCYVILGESSDDVIGQLREEELESGPHFILSDYRLRAETGIDAIAAVRAVTAVSTPAVLWSGDTSSEVLATVAASGIRLLSKPVSDSALLVLLAEHCPKVG